MSRVYKVRPTLRLHRMSDARADLRAAVRRLRGAVDRGLITVEVESRDIELLLAVNHWNKVVKPELHPEQR